MSHKNFQKGDVVRVNKDSNSYYSFAKSMESEIGTITDLSTPVGMFIFFKASTGTHRSFLSNNFTLVCSASEISNKGKEVVSILSI